MEEIEFPSGLDEIGRDLNANDLILGFDSITGEIVTVKGLRLKNSQTEISQKTLTAYKILNNTKIEL